MTKNNSKYKISPATLRKANSMLIRNGISEKTRSFYNGNINIQYHTKNGIIKKSFTNSDIKEAYEKALHTYVERI
jgi:putative salt-induced outer membrane protein YdiY